MHVYSLRTSVTDNTWVCRQVEAISQSLCPPLITTFGFLFFCFCFFIDKLAHWDGTCLTGCLVKKFWVSFISASCWGCRSVPPLQATLQDWVLDQNQLFTLAQKTISWLCSIPDFPLTVVFSMLSIHPL